MKSILHFGMRFSCFHFQPFASSVFGIFVVFRCWSSNFNCTN